MADWKKVARAALLADGKLDTKETEIIRAEIFEDDVVSKSELEFVADLRRSADGYVQKFNELFIDTVKSHMLADGNLDDNEAKWLRKEIFDDMKVDDTEKKLLDDLKAGAKKMGDEFKKLYDECMK